MEEEGRVVPGAAALTQRMQIAQSQAWKPRTGSDQNMTACKGRLGRRDSAFCGKKRFREWTTDFVTGSWTVLRNTEKAWLFSVAQIH